MKTRSPRVVVIGAGAFGGWSALWLVRRGARVTLVDAHGAGNILASSGGETRVNRALYGANAVAMRLAIRSMALWREEQAHLGVELYRERGVLWMTTTGDDSYLQAALPLLRDAGQAYEEMPPAAAARRFPAMVFDDARRVVLEPAAGYLLARRACETIAARVAAEGGTVLRGAVLPFADDGAERHERGRQSVSAADGTLQAVTLADGRRIEADQFVFALGPWLPGIFPSVLGGRIRVTRQELFTYATPAGDERFGDERLPTWIDLGASLVFGIPAPAGLMKFGDDARGALFDPTTGDRSASAEGERVARDYLARRFPALAQAPLASAQVCQYECTPDNQYLVDRLPGIPNVLIAGGGSGHGFKNGPAIGELVAAIVLGLRPVDSTFALGRPD
ncbi:MAG TPA: FAD-dependent oxidoreductase [Verrucomicrobiae bacterium]|nr:FAD-dependent oxidoreductase [Verrucomicrobiae bacterium]